MQMYVDMHVDMYVDMYVDTYVDMCGWLLQYVLREWGVITLPKVNPT